MVQVQLWAGETFFGSGGGWQREKIVKGFDRYEEVIRGHVLENVEGTCRGGGNCVSVRVVGGCLG